MMLLTIETPDDMELLGARIAARLEAGDLVALNGELGAGKTTLTRGIGAALGVRGAVTSPTFVLARTHPRASGEAPLVHVDAYRLSSAAELDDLDIDFDGSIVVVEWAAGMVHGVADSWLDVDIRRPVGGPTASAGSSGDGTETSDDTVVENTAVEDTAVDDMVEPRQVTITGHGPRWRGGAWGKAISGLPVPQPPTPVSGVDG